MRFDKVILIGSGKIACDCLMYLKDIVKKEVLYVIESQESSISMLFKYCEKQDVSYVKLVKNKRIEALLEKETISERTLIISANNCFIFTTSLINKDNVEIINFHYSLLPKYRGMNIPTWVIFNNETETGITWHYVTEQIDCGKIICQKKIIIKQDMTAFQIVREGMILGSEAFKEFIGELLDKKIEGSEVIYPETESIYYNSQLPKGGIINLGESIKDMIRLLKCFDYGKMEVVPSLRFEYQGDKYKVFKYEVEILDKCHEKNVSMEKECLTIYEDFNCLRIYVHVSDI